MHIELSKLLVKQYMKAYMLQGQADAEQISSSVVDFLADHNAFKSHARRVDLAELQARGVVAKDIRTVDPILWQRIEEAWYAIEHTFEGTGVFKLFENSHGRGFFRILQVMVQVEGQPRPIAPKDA